jgi:UDP-glucose 4-epimerase
MTLLNWQPQYADLKVILQHAWNWHAKEASVHTQQRETVEL